MLKLLLDDGKRLYFARPVDGPLEVVTDCLEISLRLELPIDPDFRSDVPLADSFPEWVESRAAIHGGARRFALHPLSKDTLEWLRLCLRDRDASAEPDQPTPDDDNVIDLKSRRRTFNWRPVAGLFILLAGTMTAGLPFWRPPVLPRPSLPSDEGLAVNVRADGNGHFHVTVEIEGIPIRAMIDTGATNVALTYEDAERLGLRPSTLTYDVRTKTANGETMKARATVSELRVGHIRAREVDVLVSRPGAMEVSLLGMNFLRNVRVRIEGDQLALFQPRTKG